MGCLVVVPAGAEADPGTWKCSAKAETTAHLPLAPVQSNQNIISKEGVLVLASRFLEHPHVGAQFGWLRQVGVPAVWMRHTVARMRARTLTCDTMVIT